MAVSSTHGLSTSRLCTVGWTTPAPGLSTPRIVTGGQTVCMATYFGTEQPPRDGIEGAPTGSKSLHENFRLLGNFRENNFRKSFQKFQILFFRNTKINWSRKCEAKSFRANPTYSIIIIVVAVIVSFVIVPKKSALCHTCHTNNLCNHHRDHNLSCSFVFSQCMYLSEIFASKHQ